MPLVFCADDEFAVLKVAKTDADFLTLPTWKVDFVGFVSPIVVEKAGIYVDGRSGSGDANAPGVAREERPFYFRTYVEKLVILLIIDIIPK